MSKKVSNKTKQQPKQTISSHNSIEPQSLLLQQQKLLKLIQFPTKTPSHPLDLQTLIQTLKQNDNQKVFQLLNSSTNDQQLIKTIVDQLQLSKVNQLLSLIHERIVNTNKPCCMKWIKRILLSHTSIAANKNNIEILKSIKQVVSVKNSTISELTKLKGKLSMVIDRQGE